MPIQRVSLLTVVALLFLVCAPAAPAAAQTSFGGVNGTVTDPSGAVVPGATARLINEATNIESRITTNQSGYFSFVNVRPGAYVLRIEATGFKTAQVATFNVGVNEMVTQNVTVSVGAVTETVQVVSGAELLQASSAELGNVIEEKAVHHLPLNGRNFTQLLVLTPGVNPVSTAQGSTTSVNFGAAEGNTGIPNSPLANASIQGQQNRSKIYYLDGIINTSVRGTSSASEV